MSDHSHGKASPDGTALAERVRALFGASLPAGVDPVAHALDVLTRAEAERQLPGYALDPVERTVDALFSISAHEFDVSLPTDGSGQGLDGLAVAVNVLATELARTAVSSAQMVSLIESLPNPVLVVTVERRVRYANPAAQAMLGTELVGRAVHDVLRAEAGLWPRESTPVRLTALLDDAHLLFSIAPLVSHYDEVEGFVAVGTNITEQVHTQEALARARDLAEANAMARTRFLANMSHELRTPLNGILGMARLLVDAGLDEQYTEHVRDIRASGEALLAMVDDVLDFSELEAGELTLDQAPFDPAALVLGCVETLEVRRPPGVALKADLAEALPARVIGDARRVRQVLLNLLGNALKFTLVGEVTVHCAVADFDAGSVRLRFDVVDTGVGMAAEDVARLFNPFTQADGSASRRFGGTGLGLAIVKRVVEGIGGEVGVESSPGKGSRFFFTARFVRASSDRLADPSDHPKAAGPLTVDSLAAAEAPLDLTGRAVLVVEDNPINQAFVRTMVRRLGATVSLAQHGAEAVDAVRAQRFDVILMDCQMPVMDGLEATRRIRRLPFGHRVPVIALTADAVVGHRERCFQAGMNAYLAKPLRVAELEITLRRLLAPPEAASQ